MERTIVSLAGLALAAWVYAWLRTPPDIISLVMAGVPMAALAATGFLVGLGLRHLTGHAVVLAAAFALTGTVAGELLLRWSWGQVSEQVETGVLREVALSPTLVAAQFLGLLLPVLAVAFLVGAVLGRPEKTSAA